ncbi:MAG TPA: NUDIX hydrolase N-terminal domain-containing protein [Thermomicrobiales bacterium]|nr:NUDIX hydrolase N-terminal domain-containing protein [Thermomicrobiales bacterium]
MRETPEQPAIAQRIALWADRLRDMSASGLYHSDNLYDRERYRQLQDLAIEMLAVATGEAPAALEPLRASVFSRPAPFPTCDAAIINDAGEVLLIQRADNRKWALPGGATETGETPAEAATREALEETGVRGEPVLLIGVYDSRLRGSASRHHLYQLVFLCRLCAGQAPETPSHAHEVLASDWFAEDALPADLDPGHIRPIRDAFRAWHGEQRAIFDPITRINGDA